MTEPVIIRLPWFTLYGMPDRPGRWARWRCVGAMLVHELVELTAGTGTAHSMRAAARFVIGAPSITVPASQRNKLYLTTVEDGFPDIYGDLVAGRVVELRVYSGGTVDASNESIFNPGELVEVRLSNPTTNDWDLIGGVDVAYLRVGLVVDDAATTFGGTYNSEPDAWEISALATLPTTGDDRLLAVLGTDPDNIASPSTGLFQHTGGGTFARVQTWGLGDAGTWIVAIYELTPGLGSTVVWLYSVGGAALGFSVLPGNIDVSALEAEVDTLTTRLGYLLPDGPVKPNLHVSKYVTFDPDFPLDGTATHVGGQLIENGQNLTILNNSTGNGGVWTLSTSGPATRATGFGSVPDEWIAQYDHVGFTGTRWAYFAMFRLYGDPTTRGMSPVEGERDGIIGGEGVTRSYRPDLIATGLSGDDLTVLNPDGSTTVVSVAAQTGTLCVLVVGDLSLLTIADGAVAQVESFASADGVWLAQGWDGIGGGTTVTVAGGTATVLSDVAAPPQVLTGSTPIPGPGVYVLSSGVTTVLPAAGEHLGAEVAVIVTNASATMAPATGDSVQSSTDVSDTSLTDTAFTLPAGTRAVFRAADISGVGVWLAVSMDAPGGSGSAADVSYDNTASGLAAEDVQAAIDETLTTAFGYAEDRLPNVAGPVTGDGIVVFDGVGGDQVKDSGVTVSGLVPTSRTLAGLDLTVNRTASALRTALGLGTAAVAESTDFATAAQGTDQRTPSDNSVTNAKVASGAAIAVSKLANGTRGQALVSGASSPEWRNITPRGNVPMAAGDYVLLSTPYGTGNANLSTAASATATNSAARYLPFWVGQRIGVNALVLEVQTGNAGGSAVIRMGLHANNAGRPGSVVVDAGTASASAAVKELSFTETFLEPGWYFAMFVFQSLDTAGTNPLVRAAVAAQVSSPAPRATVPGSTANPGVTWGSTVSGALAANPTVSAAATTIVPHIWLKVSTI